YILKEGEFHFLEQHNGQQLELRTAPRLDGLVTLHYIRDGHEEQITLAALEQRHLTRIIRPRGAWRLFGYMSIALAILALTLYVPMAIDWQRSKRYKRLLAHDPEEPA